MAYCKVCKEEIVEGSKFCIKCGTPIEAKEKEVTDVEQQQGEVGIVQTMNEENVPHLTEKAVLENKGKKKVNEKTVGRNYISRSGGSAGNSCNHINCIIK